MQKLLSNSRQFGRYHFLNFMQNRRNLGGPNLATAAQGPALGRCNSQNWRYRAVGAAATAPQHLAKGKKMKVFFLNIYMGYFKRQTFHKLVK